MSCTVFRLVSGSNVRVSTLVLPSSIAMLRCAQPQVWKSGAAMWVFQPDFSGIRESSATAALRLPPPRGAPFGVPVVPEVRITARASLAGAVRGFGSPFSIRASSVSRSPASSSTQARIRCCLTPALSISSVNSWSWITTLGFSRSQTSPSWGAANAVLR